MICSIAAIKGCFEILHDYIGLEVKAVRGILIRAKMLLKEIIWKSCSGPEVTVVLGILRHVLLPRWEVILKCFNGPEVRTVLGIAKHVLMPH